MSSEDIPKAKASNNGFKCQVHLNWNLNFCSLLFQSYNSAFLCYPLNLNFHSAFFFDWKKKIENSCIGNKSGNFLHLSGAKITIYKSKLSYDSVLP